MSQRCTVRLLDAVYACLRIEAEARRCGVSDVIREALERLLGFAPDPSDKSTTAPEPTSLSTPHDCTERLLTRLPRDVRQGLEARAPPRLARVRGGDGDAHRAAPVLSAPAASRLDGSPASGVFNLAGIQAAAAGL